jgi:hypothetical protein
MKTLYLPFILQAIIMAVDEHLHSKRNLPMWERIGHPLDTATVIIAFGYLAVSDYDPANLAFYILLCTFSCLFITKDEWVHKTECSSLEHWLHSLLFILHPLIFISAGLLWKNGEGEVFLSLLPFVLSLFMLYQIIRWSFYAQWKPNR